MGASGTSVVKKKGQMTELMSPMLPGVRSGSSAFFMLYWSCWGPSFETTPCAILDSRTEIDFSFDSRAWLKQVTCFLKFCSSAILD